jgi:type I restriction enzyme S subunit
MSEEKTPSGWVSCKFGDLAKIRNGYAFKSSSFKNGKELPDDVPLVRQSQLKGSKVDLSEAVYLPVEFLEEFSNYSLKRGDILVGMSGSIGKVCHYETETVSLQNQRTGKIDLYFEEVVNPRFLALFLSTIERKLMEMAKGMGVQNISAKDIESLPFTLPPLAEQKRIVSKIEELFSELDAGEESLRRARRQLGVYRQSLLKQAFEGKLTAPWRQQNPHLLESPDQLLDRIQAERQARYERELEEWEQGGLGRRPSKLGLISPLTEDESIFSGPLPTEWRAVPAEAVGDVQLGRQRSPKNQSKDYPTKYIRAANITESGLALDDILEMEFSPQERKTFTLHPGDLVLSEASGSASQVGKPAMWRGEIPDCCFQNTVIRHRLYDREQSVFYLWLYRFFYLHGVFSRTAGGVGINHLSAGKFSRLPLPLCSLPEQQEIVRLLDEQFTVIEQNEREIDAALKRSAALRQSILKKAFTGQLVPQDPTDEPASALLERIRKERELPARIGRKDWADGIKH